MKNKHKRNMRELKAKAAETKRVDNLRSISKTLKSDLRIVKKANKTPRGEKNIQNKPGNILELNRVSKTYVTGKRKFTALKNISFEIKKGEFVVILGPSGSGKTSLLNVLSGLDRATKGEIVVDNINIAALKNNELTTFRRNSVGFIFQNYNLLQELNAQDNAEMGRQLQVDNNKRLDIDELFKRVGMEGSQKLPISNLSGGESQRISIVRAISKNPKLLVADEPTGALDTKASEKIIELFWDINRRYGTTIIFVTHDESYVKHATKIIRVKDGQVNVEIK